MATIREILYQHTKNISARSIAKSFGISRTTIQKYLQLATVHGYNNKVNDDALQEIAIKVEESLYKTTNINVDGSIIRSFRSAPVMATLLKYQDWIKDWLKTPNMTHTQIKRLLAEEDVAVSERSINRFIQKCFPDLPKYTVHLTTEAGLEAQVDFGYVGYMHDAQGKTRKTYAFVMTLAHSRYRYVEFVFAQDQISWAKVHINAFQFFGGVPLCIVLDNLKAGVIKPDIFDPTLNETYSELSRFYGFTIDPAKAYKPEHKGKVERSVRIVKEQLIAGRQYTDIDSANAYALKWCKLEISHLICSSIGKKPIDVFNQEEKDRLLALPSGFFDMPQWVMAKIHRDHHFVVEGNFYSVPTRYIGELINVRIGLKTISAYYKHRIIKTHPRNFDKGQWITDRLDYPESARYYLDNNRDVCLELAKSIGSSTHQMIQHIGLAGTRIALRKSQAILRLATKYGNDRLEAACLRSVTYDNYEYRALCNILSNELDKITLQNASTKNTIELKPHDTSYIRPSEEYISDMEVNYAQ
jgi:transposase